MRNLPATLGIGWFLGQAFFPVLLFLVVLAGYGVVSLLCAAWPVGHQPTGTIAIAVAANPFHADLVLPAEGFRDDLGLPDDAAYLVIGWGQQAFYLETPRFEDLKPRTVIDALYGHGPSTVHVAWLSGPAARSPSVAVFAVTPHQLAILNDYVRSYLATSPDGKPTRIAGAYGKTDYFYAANGHWTVGLTCNEWVGRALRAADIRTGLWTPFSYGLLSHLQTPPPTAAQDPPH